MSKILTGKDSDRSWNFFCDLSVHMRTCSKHGIKGLLVTKRLMQRGSTDIHLAGTAMHAESSSWITAYTATALPLGGHQRYSMNGVLVPLNGWVTWKSVRIESELGLCRLVFTLALGFSSRQRPTGISDTKKIASVTERCGWFLLHHTSGHQMVEPLVLTNSWTTFRAIEIMKYRNLENLYKLLVIKDCVSKQHNDIDSTKLSFSIPYLHLYFWYVNVREIKDGWW